MAPLSSEGRLLSQRLGLAVKHGPRLTKRKALAEKAGDLQLVVEGAVLRQRVLCDGRIQTVAVYYRGDVTNLSRLVRGHETGDILVALPGTIMGTLDPAEVDKLRRLSVSELDGMAALVLRELSISEERAVTLGQRTALEGLGHFLCETLLRCRDPSANELSTDCALAMTQEVLATVLGLSSVHVNRCMVELRQLGLAELADNHLVIHDFDRLARLSNFDDAYLAAA